MHHSIAQRIAMLVFSPTSMIDEISTTHRFCEFQAMLPSNSCSTIASVLLVNFSSIPMALSFSVVESSSNDLDILHAQSPQILI